LIGKFYGGEKVVFRFEIESRFLLFFFVFKRIPHVSGGNVGMYGEVRRRCVTFFVLFGHEIERGE
jgi:hypothetical protein